MPWVRTALALIFYALLAGRAFMLRRRGIRAIVFGLTDKSDFLLLPVMLFFTYAAVGEAFRLPLPGVLGTPLGGGPAVSAAGLALCAAALCGFAVSLRALGDSFRVGIDVQKPGELVTSGPFAISRNPVYVCFGLFYAGMLCMKPCLANLLVLLCFLPAIHRQVLREEAFLRQRYGAEYARYAGRVRRYL